MLKRVSFLWVIFIVTILFCLAVAVDISPYLRGPSYYAPEWRWEYLFVNTLNKIYAPLGIILLIVLFYFWIEKKKMLQGKLLVLFLLASVLLFFFFQFSVLFFSRSGVGVLIHRIINPEINGYFTAATTIQNISDFLRNYNTLMLDFVYHAKAHPPGAILLFYYINQVVIFFSALVEWASQQIPNRLDVRLIWDTLNSSAKATVFASAILIPFLSALGVIPLYYTAKLLYGFKTALRSVFLFMVIPSLIFFIPINDAFLHIFSLSAFCFFVFGLQKNNPLLLILAGIVMFLGAFFNLSLLPVLVLFFVYFLLIEYKNIKKHFIAVFKRGIYFVLGLLLPFILLLFLFQFNFVQVTFTIMKHVPDVHTRSYTIWIFYNLYDFFVFTGIPVAIIYFTALKEAITKFFQRKRSVIDPLIIAFTAMIFILNFSGSVRGETGRLWIPYIPFIVLIVSAFMTNTVKCSTKTFAVLLGLQMLQILVMQEFWVMLW